MFVDYITLMLANLAAALFIFALFMAFWAEKDPRKAVPGFLLTGGIALVTGFAMAFTWPLPGSYNILFSEPTIMLGAVFFMAGLSLQVGWSLVTVGVFALGASAAAILLGVRILDMHLTQEPLVAALGYIASGAAAALSLPAVAFPKARWIRWTAAVVAVVAAGLWVFVGFTSYWAHMQNFSKWLPATMVPAPAPAAQ